MMKFTDAALIGGTSRTSDGYLVAEAFAVRTGIQLYTGAEVGLADREIVRVYRPEDEVRAPGSMTTFSHAPVTLGHPDEPVTSDNWKELAKGEVSTEATWDGNRIKLPLIVKDADAIAAIEGGVRELSAGYTCQLELEDGITPDGEAFDAVQRNIRINHLAIVPKGRAGSECRIGDGAEARWGASPITTSKQEKDMSDALKSVVLGDKAVNVTADAAPIIEQFKTDQSKKLADMETSHTAAIAAKDEEIGTLKADLKKAKDAVPSQEDLDKMVADRAALVATVQKVGKDIDPAGMSDADLRKAAVVESLGEDAVADASDAEIAGMFKVISRDTKNADPVVGALRSGTKKTTTNDADDAYKAHVQDLSDAWKGKKEAV